MVAGRKKQKGNWRNFPFLQKGTRNLLGVMGYPLSELWCWLRGSTHISRFVRWYTLNMLGLLYISYTPIKMVKIKHVPGMEGQVGLASESMEAKALMPLGLSLSWFLSTDQLLAVSLWRCGPQALEESQVMSFKGHGHRRKIDLSEYKIYHFPALWFWKRSKPQFYNQENRGIADFAIKRWMGNHEKGLVDLPNTRSLSSHTNPVCQGSPEKQNQAGAFT